MQNKEQGVIRGVLYGGNSIEWVEREGKEERKIAWIQGTQHVTDDAEDTDSESEQEGSDVKANVSD